jgi:hypothetical protein
MFVIEIIRNHSITIEEFMKNLVLVFISVLVFMSCQNENSVSDTKIQYPDDLVKVLDKHGSLSKWQTMQTLSYDFYKDDNPKTEMQIIDLKNRRERIEATTFKTGFDGQNYWLEADTTYKGDAVFYHNLMFYFYAMPFVLADEGINYEAVEDFEFDGITNKGIRITYNAGVGESPKDEYILYYDAATYQMTWLAYTVTYFNSEEDDNKAPKYGWIRYNDWESINGLVLPSILTWYSSEENKPTEVRSKRYFKNIEITEKAAKKATFEKTEKAVVLEN